MKRGVSMYEIGVSFYENPSSSVQRTHRATLGLAGM